MRILTCLALLLHVILLSTDIQPDDIITDFATSSKQAPFKGLIQLQKINTWTAETWVSTFQTTCYIKLCDAY